MTKMILFFAVIFPALSMASAIECTNQQGTLNIEIISLDNEKNVHWTLTLFDDPSFFYEGSGKWQKEIETEDAFSSFNELSAISYKNSRAVFVLPDNQALFFPFCN